MRALGWDRMITLIKMIKELNKNISKVRDMVMDNIGHGNQLES